MNLSSHVYYSNVFLSLIWLRNCITFITARVGRQVELTSGCIIGAMCTVTNGEIMQENTVICGSNCDRRVARERPPVSVDFKDKYSSL